MIREYFWKKKEEAARDFAMPLCVVTDKGIIDITKVRKGQMVEGANGQINRVEKVQKVLKKGTFFVINKRVVVYEHQTVMIKDRPGGGTLASLLKKGEFFTERDGSQTRIVNLKKIKGSYYFYRLSIAGDHTFFLNDILMHNASRYWVGGTATWDGTIGTRWALTSGGVGGLPVPTSSDDVFLDAASGAVTVTIANQTATCNNFVSTGFTGTLAGVTFSLDVSGTTFTLGSGSAYTQTPTTFKAASGTVTLTSNGIKMAAISFQSGASYVLADDLDTTGRSLNDGISFDMTSGTFDAQNHNVTIGRCADDGVTGTTTITMGSGTWSIIGPGSVGGFRLGLVTTLNANTSLVKFTNTGAADVDCTVYSKTLYNVWFSRGASTATITINGNASGSPSFNTFKDDGTAAHSIKFLNGQTYTFLTPGSTGFNVNGTAGNLISINSDTTGTHTLSMASGIVSCDYLNIQHSIATGGAAWYAGVNSTNNQGVATAGSGWIFTAPPSGASAVPNSNLLLMGV